MQLTELTLAPAAAISGCWALLRPHRQRALRATKCPTVLFSILSRRQKSPLPCCTRGEAACTPDRFFGSYQRSLALPCAAGCCLASERALTPSSRLPPAGGSLRETYATIYNVNRPFFEPWLANDECWFACCTVDSENFEEYYFGRAQVGPSPSLLRRAGLQRRSERIRS